MDTYTIERTVKPNNQVDSIIKSGSTVFRVTSRFSSTESLRDILIEIAKDTLNIGGFVDKGNDNPLGLSYNSVGNKKPY